MNPEAIQKFKIAIVAPVHEQPSKEWMYSLRSAAKGHSVIIVDDSEARGNIVELPEEWDIYNYDRQREALGDEWYEEFLQFHRSSACRNFGHWIAYKKEFDIVIGLDSDCIVPPDFVSKHLEALLTNSYGWVNPIKNTEWFPRGYPYHERNRRTVLNMGLWENELDTNGLDRVVKGAPPKDPKIHHQSVAHGLIPLCGMNFAMWTYAVPAFLFLPNFDDGSEKFRRYDDIWGGYIFQRLMQKNKEMIRYGFPIVYHDTIVNAEEDAHKEEAGIGWEEKFYELIDMMCADIDSKSYDRMFKDFVSNKDLLLETPFKQLVPALEWWVKIFE